MGILTVNTDFEKLYGITEREYYSKQYLTFEATSEWDMLRLILPDGLGECVTSISYSVDEGATWTTIEYNDEALVIEIADEPESRKVLFKGIGKQLYRTNSTLHKDVYVQFYSDADFKVYGNIMSLLYGDEFYGKTSFPNNSNKNFGKLFYGFDCLVDASFLILPATTLTQSCYNSMFKGCSSLATAPELPATTIAAHCYYSMFEDCISLQKAPELPATTSDAYCYNTMFKNCSELNYVKCYLRNASSSNLNNWLSGVSATGTFNYEFDANYTNGTSGIPTGWTKIAIDLPTPTQTVNFAPIAGGVTEGEEVYLSASGNKTGIKFTTDGSNPTAESQTYHDGDIVIDEATTVKAAVFNADDIDFKMGPISTAEYTIATPSLTVYVDKFPADKHEDEPDFDPDYDMDYIVKTGMTRSDYIAAEVAAPQQYSADKYYYAGETLEYNGNTYCLWHFDDYLQYGLDNLYMLTTTADYSTLAAQSIAESSEDTAFSAMYGNITIDSRGVNRYRINTEETVPYQLLKIENASDNN